MNRNCHSCGDAAATEYDDDRLCDRCAIVQINRDDARAVAALEVLAAAAVAALDHAHDEDVRQTVAAVLADYNPGFDYDPVEAVANVSAGAPRAGNLADLSRLLTLDYEERRALREASTDDQTEAPWMAVRHVLNSCGSVEATDRIRTFLAKLAHRPALQDALAAKAADELGVKPRFLLGRDSADRAEPGVFQ